jgi:adenosylhomocysteine nucleosidase
MRAPAVLVVALLLLVAGVAGCAGRVEAPGASDAGPVDVLAQGAVDIEVQPLLDALEDRRRVQLASWTFWRGRMGGKSVVVSLTEQGPINATAATTLGLQHFRPRLVINQGTAGAHDPGLRIFDIVVGRSTVDFGAFASTPAPAGAGVSQTRWTPMPHAFRIDGKEQKFASFPGDEAAARAAQATAYRYGRVIPAVIGSAFEFNNEIDRIRWIHATYGTASEDMESAFAAGAALGFKTRFLAIRVIANSAFLTDAPQPIAARHCAEFVVAVIKQLP